MWVADVPPFDLQELGVDVTHSNAEVVGRSDVVFVAVKPHLVPLVLSEISEHVTKRHIIVSVAAGVTLSTIEEVGPREGRRNTLLIHCWEMIWSDI